MTMTRQKKFAVVFCALILAAAWMLPALAAAEGKIAVVNMEEAVNNSKAGKRAQAELKRRYEKYEQELKGLREDMEKLRKDLENTAMLLKPEAKLGKEREFERKLRQFKERQRDANQDMSEAQRRSFAPILTKMKKIIADLGAKRGYLLVTEARATLYYPKSVDITPQVIAAFDKVNP